MTTTSPISTANLNERIPNLNIARGAGGALLLEQECSGNVGRIELHPVHLRHLAEVAGLLAAAGANYSPPAAVMARRLRVLLDRIDRLDDMLRDIQVKGREDVELESTFCYATWELATEFCADLGAEAPRPVPPSHAAVTRDASVTASAKTQGQPTGNPAGSAQLTLAA